MLKKNKNKHPVQSEAVLEKLQIEMKLDIELYQFIVQRFNLQVAYVNSNWMSISNWINKNWPLFIK